MINKTTILTLLAISTTFLINAQIYTPSATIQGTSGNNYVGIGITPSHLLDIHGGHNDSRILLHSNGGDYYSNQADLMLWAGEPGISWTGVGIGNNVNNFNNPLGGIKLHNSLRGGSYIRLLDNAMQFNIVASSGIDKQALTINSEGNVGIGSTNPLNNKLDVNGTIHSKEVKVDMSGWPDYVFKKEYQLATLEEVEKHITKKGHLENIPSQEEVLKNGISLGEMNAKLLQKIEELTLYMIEQEKKNKLQFQEIDLLKKENQKFQSLLERVVKLESQSK